MKSYFFTFVTSAVLLISAVSETESQWALLGVPDGGGIKSLYVTNCELFAGTEQGLFVSTDGCKTWKKADSIKGNINVVAQVEYNDNFFAATNTGGIYRSDDGASWNKTNAFDSIFCIAVNDSFILAGNTCGIQQCRVNGSVWEWATKDFSANGIVSIASRDSVVFAAGNISVAFRSTDYGKSWSSIGTNNFPPSKIGSFAICGNTVFASLFSDGVYRSTDNGINWARCNGLSSNDYGDLAIIDSTVIVSTRDGIFYTTDYGSTWHEANSGLKNKNITCLFSASNSVYIGTESDGVWYRSISNLLTPEVARKTQKPLPLGTDFRIHQKSFSKFSSTLEFFLPEKANVKIRVCDMRGCEILPLVDGNFNAGNHSLIWNASNIAPGFYFANMYIGKNAKVTTPLHLY